MRYRLVPNRPMRQWLVNEWHAECFDVEEVDEFGAPVRVLAFGPVDRRAAEQLVEELGG